MPAEWLERRSDGRMPWLLFCEEEEGKRQGNVELINLVARNSTVKNLYL